MSEPITPPAMGVPVDLLLRHSGEIETEINERTLRRDHAVAHFRFNEAEKLTIEIESLVARAALYQHLCRTYAVPLDPNWIPPGD